MRTKRRTEERRRGKKSRGKGERWRREEGGNKKKEQGGQRNTHMYMIHVDTHSIHVTSIESSPNKRTYMI